MDIVFLSHRVPFPPNKGEKIRTFHQIKFLAQRGHRIQVLAPVAGEEDIRHMASLKQDYCQQTFHAPQPGPLSYLRGLLTGQALSVSHFYLPALQRQLDQLLAAQKVDAIVCTSSSMAEYVFRSEPLRRAGNQRPALVMDFMDLDSDKWRQYQKLKSFPMTLVYGREAKLIARYEQKIHQAFDACLFISQNEVDLFMQNNPELGRVHVVANGMDTETFRPAAGPKPQQGPNFLFTGVMDYLPNEDAVVWFVEGAWEQVRARYPDAQFFIAGMNPSHKVKALSRFPGIVVTGFVDDIREYFDKAHIFIAPFRLARGVQNKVLQAFGCALPTITTAMGCEGINCKPGEHVLVADTLEQTLAQIDWVMTHPEEAARIGRNAHDLMQREYSWNGKLAALESILSTRKAAG